MLHGHSCSTAHGIFPHQGSSPCPLHWQVDSQPPDHEGSPNIITATIITKVCVLSQSVMSDSLQPHRLQSTRILCPWGYSRQEYWSGLPCPPPGDISNPGIEPRSPPLQADSLLSEPPGKPKNTGVGSLSLLQRIFPTQ